MNLRQIQDIAGHRDVPPWVVKLVQDCIEHDRTWEREKQQVVSSKMEHTSQEPVALMSLLKEARDTCKAAIVEDGISAMRKEYRIDLERRLTAYINTTPPASQQEQVACPDCSGTGEMETGIGMFPCDSCHGSCVKDSLTVQAAAIRAKSE